MPLNHSTGSRGELAPTVAPSSRNGVQQRHKRQQPNIASLVDEVETLRAALRTACTRSNELLRVVRQRRRQDRVVRNTLKTLRRLRETGL